MGVPESRGPYLGAPITRIILCWVPSWSPPFLRTPVLAMGTLKKWLLILGNHHLALAEKSFCLCYLLGLRVTALMSFCCCCLSNVSKESPQKSLGTLANRRWHQESLIGPNNPEWSLIVTVGLGRLPLPGL